jgi:hypothetical protein
MSGGKGGGVQLNELLTPKIFHLYSPTNRPLRKIDNIISGDISKISTVLLPPIFGISLSLPLAVVGPPEAEGLAGGERGAGTMTCTYVTDGP